MIAEIRGTRIILHFSFVAATTLMLYFCDERVVLCAFCASLFHECGHLAFIRLSGESPRFIELGAFGIRIDRPEGNLLSYKKEILIALGGIIFNLAGASLLFVCRLVSGREIFLILSVVNITVAAINALPNGNLDAGRALYFALLCFAARERADKTIHLVSVIFTVIFLVLWLLYSLFFGFNISLCAVAIYLTAITFKRKVDK